MTKEEIIQMAKKCGWDNPATNMMPLYEFAKLVAEHERDAFTAHAMTSAEKAIDVAIKLEREACAKVCDGYSDGRHANMADLCAETIRARGEQE